jgi:hypothetical protein
MESEQRESNRLMPVACRIESWLWRNAPAIERIMDEREQRIFAFQVEQLRREEVMRDGE